MPGFEIFGDEERKEVQDVLGTGVLFRYGFDAVRNGHWKARTFEEELARRLGAAHCHLCSSGTAALSIAQDHGSQALPEAAKHGAIRRHSSALKPI